MFSGGVENQWHDNREYRSSYFQMFYKKSVLKSFAKFTGLENAISGKNVFL